MADEIRISKVRGFRNTHDYVVYHYDGNCVCGSCKRADRLRVDPPFNVMASLTLIFGPAGMGVSHHARTLVEDYHSVVAFPRSMARYRSCEAVILERLDLAPPDQWMEILDQWSKHAQRVVIAQRGVSGMFRVAGIERVHLAPLQLLEIDAFAQRLGVSASAPEVDALWAWSRGRRGTLAELIVHEVLERRTLAPGQLPSTMQLRAASLLDGLSEAARLALCATLLVPQMSNVPVRALCPRTDQMLQLAERGLVVVGTATTTCEDPITAICALRALTDDQATYLFDAIADTTSRAVLQTRWHHLDPDRSDPSIRSLRSTGNLRSDLQLSGLAYESLSLRSAYGSTPAFLAAESAMSQINFRDLSRRARALSEVQAREIALIGSVFGRAVADEKPMASDDWHATLVAANLAQKGRVGEAIRIVESWAQRDDDWAMLGKGFRIGLKGLAGYLPEPDPPTFGALPPWLPIAFAWYTLLGLVGPEAMVNRPIISGMSHLMDDFGVSARLTLAVVDSRESPTARVRERLTHQLAIADVHDPWRSAGFGAAVVIAGSSASSPDEVDTLLRKLAVVATNPESVPVSMLPDLLLAAGRLCERSDNAVLIEMSASSLVDWLIGTSVFHPSAVFGAVVLSGLHRHHNASRQAVISWLGRAPSRCGEHVALASEFLQRGRLSSHADRVLPRYLSPHDVKLVLAVGSNNRRSSPSRAGPPRSRFGELTPAQAKVAELTVQGYSAQEVAAALHLSPRTVTTHLGAAYRTLRIHSRRELAAEWARRG